MANEHPPDWADSPLERMASCIQMYVDRYRISKKWWRFGIPICQYCSTAFHEEGDSVLRHTEEEPYWHRYWACAKCVASIVEVLKFSVWDVEQSRLLRRGHSVTVMLLLEEAGLCRDVTWGLVVLAYWIL